jgi:hypothetical protein
VNLKDRQNLKDTGSNLKDTGTILKDTGTILKIGSEPEANCKLPVQGRVGMQ